MVTAQPRERELKAAWHRIDRRKRRVEARIARKARSLFRRQQADVLERLRRAIPVIVDKARPTFRTKDREGLADSVFDLWGWIEETLSEVAPDLLEAIMEGKDQARRSMGDRITVSQPTVMDPDDPRVNRIMQEVMEKAKGIPQTTRRHIADELEEALRRNETIDQMEARLKGVFRDAVRNRSRVIAQTTVTAGFEGGQLAAFAEAGIGTTRWLSQRDGRVRDTHWVADGQERAPGEPFEVGAARLLHPGDPEGPAREVIGCRCTLLPIIKEDE